MTILWQEASLLSCERKRASNDELSIRTITRGWGSIPVSLNEQKHTKNNNFISGLYLDDCGAPSRFKFVSPLKPSVLQWFSADKPRWKGDNCFKKVEYSIYGYSNQPQGQ